MSEPHQNKPIVIVGAGITGCVIAYKLAQAGKKVIIIEKEKTVSGLARTFRYGDFTFDIGPHRFYTGNKKIASFIKTILKNDYEILPRISSVYFLKKYHTWPLRPKIIFDLPIPILMRSSCELISSMFKRNHKKIENFKDYIIKYYGPTLYEIFYKDYTKKFLGLSPENTHYNWAQEAMKRTIIDERMRSRNLWEILKLTFMFFPLRTEFVYPKGGIDLFCKNLINFTKQKDATIYLEKQVDAIHHNSGKIESIELNEKLLHPEHLIWTGDINALCSMLDLPAKRLNYLSLLLYNVILNVTIEENFQWCYYGSKDLIFSRITVPSKFDKNMVPPGKESICVEVTCKENDVWWKNPESLIIQIKEDLKKVGIIETVKDIDDIHIEKISNAYPLYAKEYSNNLRAAKTQLQKFNNLTLAGRTGLFWYNNMDDSIENGLKISNKIICG